MAYTELDEIQLEGISYWIGVRQCKEKFGTVRVYCGFGCYNLHSLIFPKWMYKHPRYPDWLWRIDHTTSVMNTVSLLNYILVPWQTRVYRWIYKRAVKKWPHQKERILCCADYNEYLKDL